MDSALDPFREAFKNVKLSPPRIPWVSTMTGDWMTPELATDPEYWVQQLRQPVRFSDAVRKLAERSNVVFLEVGPGHTLSSLVHQHRGRPASQAAVTSLGPDPELDVQAILGAAGRLWIAGVKPDWEAIHAPEKRRRVPLPTYPFARTRHWIDPLPIAESETAGSRPTPRTVAAPAGAGDGKSGAPDPEAPGARPVTETGIAGRLRAVLASASGIPEAQIDASRTLLDQGFDSLLLVRVSATIEKTFGVKVSFRQLLEELLNIKALAAHLETRLEAAAAPAANPATAVAAASRVAAGSMPLPPVPGARRGRDAAGNDAWFVPDPDRPGKYLQVTSE